MHCSFPSWAMTSSFRSWRRSHASDDVPAHPLLNFKPSLFISWIFSLAVTINIHLTYFSCFLLASPLFECTVRETLFYLLFIVPTLLRAVLCIAETQVYAVAEWKLARHREDAVTHGYRENWYNLVEAVV